MTPPTSSAPRSARPNTGSSCCIGSASARVVSMRTGTARPCGRRPEPPSSRLRMTEARAERLAHLGDRDGVGQSRCQELAWSRRRCEGVGVGPAEADPVVVHPTRGWRLVRTLTLGGSGGWCWCARVGDRAAAGVGELDAVGVIGVAGDAEQTLVVHPVVSWAQADQVPRVGRAAVVPVDDVVDLDEPIRRAPRHPTTAVAALDDAAGAIRHDVLRTTHARTGARPVRARSRPCRHRCRGGPGSAGSATHRSSSSHPTWCRDGTTSGTDHAGPVTAPRRGSVLRCRRARRTRWRRGCLRRTTGPSLR